MGYNLELACHTCREKCGALRGEEARVISVFASRHGRGHERDVLIDNGYSDRDFPEDYYDSWDEIHEELP